MQEFLTFNDHDEADDDFDCNFLGIYIAYVADYIVMFNLSAESICNADCESNDFSPFSSKLNCLLFIMLNSPRPLVSQLSYYKSR